MHGIEEDNFLQYLLEGVSKLQYLLCGQGQYFRVDAWPRVDTDPPSVTISLEEDTIGGEKRISSNSRAKEAGRTTHWSLLVISTNSFLRKPRWLLHDLWSPRDNAAHNIERSHCKIDGLMGTPWVL